MPTKKKSRPSSFAGLTAIFAVLSSFAFSASTAISQQSTPGNNLSIAVGPQYDSTHVYVSPSDLESFVKSFIATFGGQASKPQVMNVLPVPSSTEFQSV